MASINNWNKISYIIKRCISSLYFMFCIYKPLPFTFKHIRYVYILNKQYYVTELDVIKNVRKAVNNVCMTYTWVWEKRQITSIPIITIVSVTYKRIYFTFVFQCFLKLIFRNWLVLKLEPGAVGLYVTQYFLRHP